MDNRRILSRMNSRNVNRGRQRQTRRAFFETLENRYLLANAIVAENLLPGSPASEWDIVGAGDSNIEGYAAEISVDQGQPVQFKVNTNATDYRLDIYRLGYYGGLGARKVATVQPALVPFAQPSPIEDLTTGLVDAGNWSTTATWNMPANAVSGVYVAKLVREDGTPGANHIVFVVRDDDGASDLLFQTSDTTWQAYNNWGGSSLYDGYPDGRAYKLSYNRPFNTRGIGGGGGETNWVFWAESPMIRWMEKNGYDVSYTTDVDTDRRGSELLEHRAFLSVGHDEYWSGQQRTNVEAARDAGVNLAFFSGNDVYWKTRWENSIDGSNTPYKTLVSYKETKANAKIDPLPDVWTGTWRDPRFSPPADGGRPENALIGTIFTVNRGASTFGTSIQVPEPDGKLRFWRNTTVASLQPGEIATLTNLTLGYEWNEDLDNGFRPAGLIRMSSTTENVTEKLQDYGNTVAPGVATHSLTLYRANSGALVFSAGTVQWSFGLDATHDGPATVADPRMQQATVNLFADMGIQPATLQPNLVAAARSTDVIAPSSIITSPSGGLTVQSGSTPITITGTASDIGGVVGGIEVSVDSGATWHRANGRGSWSYAWIPSTPGPITIRSRAADDSGNKETPFSGISITVVPDNTTAPQISAVNQLVVDNQTAVISWTTDEASDSRVIFGVSAGNLNQTVFNSAAVTSHSVTLANLTPNTNYFYRVISVDEYGNSSTSPIPPSGPGQVSTPAFTDTTQADFASGTLSSGISLVQSGDGEVILAPTLGAEFQSPGVPAGWSVIATGAGGGATVGGGTVSVDGARLSAGAIFAPGRALEFVATFSGAAFQSIGLGIDLIDKPWAIFGSVSGGGLYARTASGTNQIDTLIPGNWLGTSHRFRVEWNAVDVAYLIDGVEVARHAVAIQASMRPIISDFNAGGGSVVVDWLRLSPYSSSGEYLSRVFDAGSPVVWTRMSWIAEAPLGTNLVQMVRMGTTATPDATWTDFIPVASSGATIGGKSRYLQYRTQLTTSIPGRTPVLHNVALSYSTTNLDTYAPTIISHDPVSAAANVSPSAPIVAKFSELMNVATINNSTVRLRKAGTSIDVPATVSLAGSTVTLQPLTTLVPESSYTVTFAGSIADTSGNGLGGDVTWSFSAGWLSFADTSLNDFGAGQTGTSTAVTQSSDGEVTLAPSVAAEFNGASLPSGWFSQPWIAGVATVGSGQLRVDGAMSGTTSYFAPGQTLEFSATFNGDPYQHVGFGVELIDAPWAIFSTGSGGMLQVRTSQTMTTALPGVSLGVPHEFRIDWNNSGITYYVDGVQVALHSVAITGNMRPLVSDYLPGGGDVKMDWLRVLPYKPTGTFQSRVFDAGKQVAWDRASWNAIVPANTSLAVSARVGNSASPDESWTDYMPVASGTLLGSSSRYAQYRVDLSTTALTNYLESPEFHDFALRFSDAISDTTPLELLSQSPATAALDVTLSTSIVVAFNDLVDPATVQASSFRLRAVGAFSDVPAFVSVSGSRMTLQPNGLLDPKTNYQVTLAASVADLSGNSLGSDVTWTFTTSWLNIVDSTSVDFSLGTLSGAAITADADGEVSLSPQASESFSGSSLPSGWSSTPWNAGGSTTISGGMTNVNGALLATTTFFQPGSTAEFTARFSGAAYQHLGWGVDLNGPPWAMFSTREGNALYARTSNLGDTLIPGNWFTGPHKFRIEWGAANVNYLIDDVLVATHIVALSSPMRAFASDYSFDAGAMQIYDVRVLPYQPTGSFVSRVLDAGATVTWDVATWNATLPAAATSVAIRARMGQTPVPDDSWTDFAPLSSSGAVIGGSSRYLQYSAQLATANTDATPSLSSFSVRYSADSDTTNPAVLSRTPAPTATGVGLFSQVRVAFTELMDSSSIDSSTLRLRTLGSSVDVPATVTFTGGALVLQPAVALAGNTTYEVLLSPNVRDLGGNSLGSSIGWTFITGPGYWTQTSAAEFLSGTHSETLTTNTSGGEVELASSFNDDFNGTTLGSAWSVQSWESGATNTAVSGGMLQAGGVQIRSAVAYPDAPILGRVRFGATPYQHFGLATDLSAFGGNYWAIFSTGGTNNTLFARVNVSGTTQEVNLGSLPSGFHDYRIVPSASAFEFYVDGQLRTTIAATFPPATPVRAAISSYLANVIEVDSIRFEQFAASGEFVSSVFDATREAAWSTINWSAITPQSTTLVVEVRLGNSATPDASWSTWTPVANGAAVNSLGRYLQFRVRLETLSAGRTPSLSDITFLWE